ncbi:Rpn family recombination-promoting nuclease/putative transposase [Oscillatoria salina]|uniref:Rpn family recombination-promoting nuclease/putative transposase n=1 Tax=Oscillatoria salina TaxID=331517 RepID=UPI0013B6C97E|nr:Rpn family recombination-promoting nuclease/putative transposase [Oscillatoria salina]MBZ8178673.1 Rpn family recombination-promoting nuclease/putative transposase [Oscillatoria salina IIICB1]NET90480.1 Rpn family recombination-promoting nuclease/putative transposase [Kamptonema sp. SIO1D9]
MKTDTIFYRLFQSFPSSFFELIQLPPSTAETYQFASVEIKQLAFRIDGVFLPATEATEEPIYFVEVQFQPDKNFYSRFFAEIFLYLDKTELKNDWRAVVIYPTRNTDKGEITRYRALLASEQVNRLYLDELDFTTEETLGIETVKLVVADEETAPVRARQLIEKATTEITDASRQRELIQLIETIVVYKFTNLSRKEIEAMLGLGDIKQSKVYQEAFQEGEERVKLAAVPAMLALGASVEYIAEVLAMDVEEVSELAQNQPQINSGDEN